MGLFKRKKRVSPEEREEIRRKLEDDIISYVDGYLNEDDYYHEVRLDKAFRDLGLDDLDFYFIFQELEDIYGVEVLPPIDDGLYLVEVKLQDVSNRFLEAIVEKMCE